MLKAKGIELLTVKIVLIFRICAVVLLLPLFVLILAFSFLLTFAAIYKKWFLNLMLE
jgi:hypothetical protein